MVRSRCILHLQNLRERFPALESKDIIVLPQRDYRYRLVRPKKLWSSILAELSEEQDWSNFKSEAARYQGASGSAYIRALHDVWNTMYGLQTSERNL